MKGLFVLGALRENRGLQLFRQKCLWPLLGRLLRTSVFRKK